MQALSHIRKNDLLCVGFFITEKLHFNVMFLLYGKGFVHYCQNQENFSLKTKFIK